MLWKVVTRSGFITIAIVVSIVAFTARADAAGEAHTVLISKETNGSVGNEPSYACYGDYQFSENGRFVLFVSKATNLDPKYAGRFPENNPLQVYIHDRDADKDGIFDEPDAGATSNELISVDSNDNPGRGESTGPATYGEGRFVAFQNYGLTQNHTIILLKDRHTGTLEEIGRDCSGNTAEQCTFPSFSRDGRFIAFYSTNDLGCDDKNDLGDCYVFDRDWDGGTPTPNGVYDEAGDGTRTVLVSLSTTGEQGNAHANVGGKLSPDARYVTFMSWANNLVDDDMEGFADVFVRDRDSDEDHVYDESDAVRTWRVSLASDGKAGNNWSNVPSISGVGPTGGPYVAFYSYADNLVYDDKGDPSDPRYPFGGDNNHNRDVFVHDVSTCTTIRVNTDSAGRETNDDSFAPGISFDGRFIAYTSLATNLVLPDCQPYAETFLLDRDVRDSGTYDRCDNVATFRMSLGPPDKPFCERGLSACRQADGKTFDDVSPAIGGDGRWILIASVAKNLTDPPTSGEYAQVYLRDRGDCIPPAVTKHPPDVLTVYYGADAMLDIVAIGDSKFDLSYQWYKDGNPLTCDDRISGCDSPTLTIKNAQVGKTGDSGRYDCVVTNDCDCSEVWSAPANLTVKYALGDMNCDSCVNFDDIDGFVLAIISRSRYEAAYPNCDWLNGDCTGDGIVNFDDIDCFVEALINGGCD